MKIVINTAAHGLVGSNLHIFTKIARSMIQLLILNKVPLESEMISTIEGQLNAVAE